MPLTSSKKVGSKQRAAASTLQGSEVDGGRDDCRWQLSLSKVTSNRVSFISDHPLDLFFLSMDSTSHWDKVDI